MKADDPNAKEFPVEANWNNTYIAGTSDRRKDVAAREREKLDAKEKTVIITDPYLFKQSDAQYDSDLKDILCGLNAKEIKYCAQTVWDQNLFNDAQSLLAQRNCVLTHDPGLRDCHDRFWLCVESQKAAVFGTSLNGLCKRICRVDSLTDAEVTELMKELQARGMIA